MSPEKCIQHELVSDKQNTFHKFLKNTKKILLCVVNYPHFKTYIMKDYIRSSLGGLKFIIGISLISYGTSSCGLKST